MREGLRNGLAMFAVCLYLAGCMEVDSTTGGADTRFVGDSGNADSEPVRLLVSAPLGADSPTPVSLTRDMARKALQTGEMVVHLADGTHFPLRMLREQPEAGGRSTFIGRVETRFGPQSAVLTFGDGVVFGVLPLPDGGTMSISTTKGVTSIAPSGGIVPPVSADAAPSPDYVLPPNTAMAAGLMPGASASIAPLVGPVSQQTRLETGSASAQTVQIVLLGLYGDDLVNMRGNIATAEAEVVNQVAIVNQAHIDSGSVVRFSLAGLKEFENPPGISNHVLLAAMRENQVPGIDVHALRDEMSADLVFAFRTYPPGDPACGVAFLTTSLQGRSAVDDQNGFSVNSSSMNGECGPYVLAHELGHNLGSLHDRETETDWYGTAYGAYSYSFGYRSCPGDAKEGFATIMAYMSGMECSHYSLGYFSNPMLQSCSGSSCGEQDRADNVRAFARMAPAIAAFRGKPGTVSVANIEAVEPRAGRTTWVQVPIRLSGVAPPGGVRIKAWIVGGTASPGVDYEVAPEIILSIHEGERRASFLIGLLPDDDEEGDESILVRLENVHGAAIDIREAVVTIVDDDSGFLIRGQMRFPPGSQPPAAFRVEVMGPGITTADLETYEFTVSPPDFNYAIRVPAGSAPALYAYPPEPFAAFYPLRLGQVDFDLQYDHDIPLGISVSGRIRVPEGMEPPQMPMQADVSTASRGLMGYSWGFALNLDEPYRFFLPPGVTVTVRAQPGPPYANYERVIRSLDSDTVSDIVLSTQPTLFFDQLGSEQVERDSGHSADARIWVRLSSPAPEGGVSASYRFVSGTASAGSDFVAEGGALHFPQGSSFQTVWAPLLGDDLPEEDEHFRVVIDGVVGAVVEDASMPIYIRDDDRSVPPGPGISVGGTISVVEGDAGSRPMARADVQLSGPVPESGASFRYRTIASTASAGMDYQSLDRKLVMAPGVDEATIEVAVFGDDWVEGDETFEILIDQVQGVVPVAEEMRVLVVLRDDDEAPPPEPEPEPEPEPAPAPAPAPEPVPTPRPDNCGDFMRGAGAKGARTCR